MIENLIEELIYYAKLNLDLNEEDEIFMKNILCGILKVDNSGKQVKISKEIIKEMQTPDAIIDKIADYAEQKLNVKNRELYKTFIMGIVTPKPSFINERFKQIEKEDGCG